MNSLATWLTALGTLLLAVVAVFQDKIRRWLTSPNLQLEVRLAPPECHLTTWTKKTVEIDPNTGHQYLRQVDIACYYCRVKITNNGTREAREVELFAKNLKRHNEGLGEFEELPRFTPMNLLWAHVRQPFLGVLSPSVPKLCDLAHMVDPDRRQMIGHQLPEVDEGQTILALDLQIEPNSGGHLLGPGYYRLTLILAAANASPKEYVLDIRITGDWYDDEARMFGEGLRLRLH